MTFTLDGFEIGERLGSGGFGEVWQARQVGVDRPVAIKVGNTPISDAADQLRFERECKALGRLSTHPNIVTVYTSSQLPDGRPVLVLEFVDGGTLQQWAMNNSSSEPQLLNLGADLAGAVLEAHRQKILHRDLKPQNVLLRTTGQAILADFGIAQLQDGLRTVTGNVTASAAYAPPEVLDGERASERADLYGIGICLLAAATQTTPFTTSEDDTLYPVLTRVLTAQPPDLTEFGYSAELNSLVQRLLAKDPGQRPDTAAAVLAEFEGMNAGLHRHQRVTPQPISASGGEEATEGPATIDPSASVPPLAAPPSAQPAPAPTPAPTPVQELAVAAQPVVVPPAPVPVAPPGASAPPTVAVPPEAPVTAPVPVHSHAAAGGAASAPATPVTGPPADPSSSPSSSLVAIIFGGLVIAAVALFLLFGRSDSESAVTAVETAATTAPAVPQTDNENDEQVTQEEPTAVPQAAPIDDEPPTNEPAAGDPVATASPVEVISLPITEPLEVSGTIDVALDFRDFPIELVAGQEVSVEVASLNGSCDRADHFDLHINVLDGNGDPIGDDAWPGNYGCEGFGGSEWKAPENGTYNVRFSSGNGGSMGSTGSFEATIATLRRERAAIDLSALAVIEATIDRALDSTSYEFDLRVGQAIGVGINSINDACERAEYFDLRFALFDPDGKQVGDDVWPGNYGCDASGRWTAESDGRYTLSFFSGDDTGFFEAIVGVLTSPVVSLDGNERVHPVGHSFEIPRDEIFYELDLSQGQAISVEVTDMNGSCDRADHFALYIRVLDPQGDVVGDEGWPGNYGCQGFGPWEARVDGRYQVQFYEASGGTGAFEATIGRLGG